MGQRDEAAQQISATLLETWDPIGVRDTDVQPETEYLYEARSVFELLTNGTTRDQLAAFLQAQAAILRATSNIARDRYAADRLINWHEEQRQD